MTNDVEFFLGLFRFKILALAQQRGAIKETVDAARTYEVFIYEEVENARFHFDALKFATSNLPESSTEEKIRAARVIMDFIKGKKASPGGGLRLAA